MKRFILFVLCGLVLPGSLLAASGCGFGTRLYGDSLLGEIFALSADAGSSVSNSLSITSGTSGCSNSGVVMKERQKNYIVHTYPNLEEDVIKGSGPYLVNLSEVMGCSAKVPAEFRSSVQTTIEGLVAEPMNQQEKALEFYRQLNFEMISNPVLANACHQS